MTFWRTDRFAGGGIPVIPTPTLAVDGGLWNFCNVPVADQQRTINGVDVRLRVSGAWSVGNDVAWKITEGSYPQLMWQ
jgi:hypothetical protein